MRSNFIFLALIMAVFITCTHSYGMTVVGGESAESSKVTQPAGVNTSGIKVIGIFVKSIDDQYIYSEDGKKFPISSQTRIIKNIQKSNRRIAELVFNGETLVGIVIK